MKTKEERGGRLVFCRRLKREIPVAEHLSCRYCFGGAEDVGGAVHDEFCDFEEGEDPIVFGFPEGSARHQKG